ncbi:MAG: sodium:solute symporter family protein [Bacteroidia bacterium]
MTGVFIILYIAISLGIGLYASRRVKTEEDFVLAGKNLPLYLSSATVFATWFGSETLLGATASFHENGLLGIIEDPFGAALCLFLVGIFFARKLYRMNMLTFGDFYKIHFGRSAEVVSGLFLIISYFGWIAAQFVAMGYLLHSIYPGVSMEFFVLLSALVITLYTITGGMWAVSVTDFFQTILIIIGLIVCTAVVVIKSGGMQQLLNAAPESHYTVLPENNFSSWSHYLAAWMTIGLGSIPQQDVFQRVMSSRSEKHAVLSSVIGGVMYLTVALLPIVLVLGAMKLQVQTDNGELLLPRLILEHTNDYIAILFFGALLSAIMSTASGALLAPSVILGENLIAPLFKNKDSAFHLKVTRLSIAGVTLISMIMALLRKDIYELVGEASEISLVSLFVPLCAGLFLKSKNSIAALCSMISGFLSWLCALYYNMDFPPIFTGLFFSVLGYAITVLFIHKERSVS